MQHALNQFFYIRQKEVKDIFKIYQEWDKKIDLQRWENLRVRMLTLFLSENRTALQQCLQKFNPFYSEIQEFQVFIWLNQYLICKENPTKEEFKILLNSIIWEQKYLHLIIKSFLGYLIVAKVKKNPKVLSFFEKIGKLIQNPTNEQIEDIKGLLKFWLKTIKAFENDDCYKESLQKLMKFTKYDPLLVDQISKLLDQIVEKKPIYAPLQMPQQKPQTIQLNNYLHQSSYKRPKKLTTQKDSDSILKLKLENFQISQLVKSGVFKMKDFSTQYTNRLTRTNIKTQQSVEESRRKQTHQTHDSIIEIKVNNQPFIEQPIEVQTPKSIKIPEFRLVKQNSQYNPYKLRNLISNRFEQILDIGNTSPIQTPRNVMKQSQQIRVDIPELNLGEQLFSSIHQNEQLRKSSRRSGVRIDIEEDLQTQQLLLPVEKKLSRSRGNIRTGRTFQAISEKFIPATEFSFFFDYQQRGTEWSITNRFFRDKMYVCFKDITYGQLTYRLQLDNKEKQTEQNWSMIYGLIVKQLSNQVMQQIPYLQYNYQIKSTNKLQRKDSERSEIIEMGFIKDLFRWLYTTYLYEQRRVTGSVLTLVNQKDKILNASRELLNVIRFQRHSLRKSIYNDPKEYYLLQRAIGETVSSNIKLLNEIIIMRFNIQKNTQYLIHKQVVNLKFLSLDQDEETEYAFITVSLKLTSDQIITKGKYYFKALPNIELVFKVINSNIQPLILKYESVMMLLNEQCKLEQLIDYVLFQKNKFNSLLFDFINTQLMINEQKQLQVKINIFSIQDAQKMEACGMKLGFLLDLKTKTKPFAITELERYIQDDQDKQKEDYQASVINHQREHMFDKQFNSIFAQENRKIQQTQTYNNSLLTLVRRYNTNTTKADEIAKVGQVVVLQENPFYDIHDDFDLVKNMKFSRFKLHDQKKYCYRIKFKYLCVNIEQNTMTIKFRQLNKFQKFIIKQYDEDDYIIERSLNLLNNTPLNWLFSSLFRRTSLRALKTSFMNINLRDGFDVLKSIKSKSDLSEIPSNHIIHYQLLNNPMSLSRYFNFKQFTLMHKIKNIGLHHITIRVFYRLSIHDQINEQDQIIIRIDFQPINSKIGMSKMIFNKHDLTENLKLTLPQYIVNGTFVDIVIKVFDIVQMGHNNLNKIPYFYESQTIGSSQLIDDGSIDFKSEEDKTKTGQVQRIRRISNNQENSTFKKAELCKGFLEHYIKNARLVLTFIKPLYVITHRTLGQIVKISQRKINSPTDDHQSLEYCVIQILRHLLQNYWIIKVYVPKTTRYMVTILESTDLVGLNKGLFQSIHLKHRIQNNYINPSISFRDFQKKQNLNEIHYLRINNRKSTFSQKPQEQYANFLQDFLDLTQKVNDGKEFIKVNDESIRLYAFLEAQIWMSILKTEFDLEIAPKQSQSILAVNFGKSELPLQELLFQRYIRIDRVGESHIEFYMQYQQKQERQEKEISKGFAILRGRLGHIAQKANNKRFSGLVEEYLMNDEQIRFIKRTSIFFPFDNISYANTSNYNIEIKYYSYNKFTEVKEFVNLRELLNLFIADGFYKYQTNYMNSKLNLSDILNICYYIIHKIKTQNFLNLSQYHSIPGLNQLKNKTNKQKKDQKPRFYSQQHQKMQQQLTGYYRNGRILQKSKSCFI